MFVWGRAACCVPFSQKEVLTMTNSSETRVLGLALKAFVTGVSDDLQALLPKYGFSEEIADHEWYLRRSYLAMLHEIARPPHLAAILSVGLQIARLAPLPPVGERGKLGTPPDDPAIRWP